MNQRIKKKKRMQALKEQILSTEIYRIDEIIKLEDSLIIKAHIK
ncbi:hypothetical protein [Anaerovorax sp. IOR16]|nr:hypothetical protein [Anaerovorax sp. IOR16]